MENLNQLDNLLNTTVLPQYNCSNCKNFIIKNREILENKVVGRYAVECNMLVYPLTDCILRGFKCHSEQPTFSQTLNK
jgi:hypothetical protein